MTEVQTILKKYPDTGRDNLIPILQDIQNNDGYLSKDSIIEVGKHLHMPTSKIFGVATFYNQFTFSPRGEHHITLCNGSSCHMGGSGELLAEITKMLEIKDGQTTRDRLFSLEVQSCIGACGQSPVMAINGKYYSGVGVKEVRAIIKKYQKDASR